MRAIINGRIVDSDGIISGKALIFDGKIQAISDSWDGCDVIDAGGGYVTPGLIDVHAHGYLGADASDGDLPGLMRMAEGMARNGVTAFLPTTMTVSYEQLEAAFGVVRSYMAAPSEHGAAALGVNAEGPFLSPAKRGAHDIAMLRAPDAQFLLKHADVVRLATIAPDLPGAMECISALVEGGIRVSAGHTTADFETAVRSIDAGATQATHTFNAMPALNHREPGATGAFLWDDRVYCELIADGFHVHPAFFKLLRRMKGDHLVLITDCTRAGGMGDGEYDLGGQLMRVEGIRCLLPDGTIAGSILRLNMAVKNMIRLGGASVWEAVNMASANPAAALGISHKKGALRSGMDADIAIFDDDFEPRATLIGGRTAYERH